MGIQNIVLVPDSTAADKFMELIFPHYCEYFLASADRRYPLDPQVNKAVFEKLESDPSVQLVVFGFDSLLRLKPKTQKLLILDDFVFGASSAWEAERQFKRPMDEFAVIGLIKSFFFQWERMERLGWASDFYRLYPGIDREKLGPLLDLFIDHKTGPTVRN